MKLNFRYIAHATNESDIRANCKKDCGEWKHTWWCFCCFRHIWWTFTPFLPFSPLPPLLHLSLPDLFLICHLSVTRIRKTTKKRKKSKLTFLYSSRSSVGHPIQLVVHRWMLGTNEWLVTGNACSLSLLLGHVIHLPISTKKIFKLNFWDFSPRVILNCWTF